MSRTTKKHLDIALSESAPVSIDPDLWPVIVQVKGDDERRMPMLFVRQHADGRAIVYGHARAPTPAVAGFIVGRDEDLVRAIRRTAGAIGCGSLGQRAIMALPPKPLS